MDQMTSHLQTVSVTLCSVRLAVSATDRFVLVRAVTRVRTFSFRKDFDAPGEKKYHHEFSNKMWHDPYFIKTTQSIVEL